MLFPNSQTELSQTTPLNHRIYTSETIHIRYNKALVTFKSHRARKWIPNTKDHPHPSLLHHTLVFLSEFCLGPSHSNENILFSTNLSIRHHWGSNVSQHAPSVTSHLQHVSHCTASPDTDAKEMRCASDESAQLDLSLTFPRSLSHVL